MGGEGRRDEGKRGDTFLPYHRLLKTQCLICSWYMKLYQYIIIIFNYNYEQNKLSSTIVL